MEKISSKSGFPIFGGKFYVVSLKLVLWPPYCNRISDFRVLFLLCFVLFFDNVIGDVHFSAKFVRESTFLNYGP